MMMTANLEDVGDDLGRSCNLSPGKAHPQPVWSVPSWSSDPTFPPSGLAVAGTSGPTGLMLPRPSRDTAMTSGAGYTIYKHQAAVLRFITFSTL